jgi:hypothetical protein
LAPILVSMGVVVDEEEVVVVVVDEQVGVAPE